MSFHRRTWSHLLAVATILAFLFLAACTSNQEESPSAESLFLQEPDKTETSATPALPTTIPAVKTATDSVKGLLLAFQSPPRDLYSLTQRLRLKSNAPIPRVVNGQPPQYEVGRKDTFTVTNLDTFENFTVEATLRYVGSDSYWYVEDGVKVAQDALQRSANTFEESIYPTVVRLFGPVITPGVDNDAHLTVLNARIPGVAGYYSSMDEYPKVVNRFSNEREMVYMNIDATQPGTRQYEGVLAHELQHAAHQRGDPTEQTWVNEGLSELSADLAGYGPRTFSAFTSEPDTQLTDWSDHPNDSGAHYSAAYLFMRYLYDHYGGPQMPRALVDEPEGGIKGINAYLAAHRYKEDFWGVFADWTVANYLDGSGVKSYEYPTLNVKVRPTTVLSGPEEIDGSVHQFGSDYIEVSLPSGDAIITFQGADRVPILPNKPHGGSHEWWGNRADSMDSTLTRAFDLSAVKKATLQFWTWYDTEKDWDYAYVEASTDEGQTWTALAGKNTSDRDPLGNSFGNGYTGVSGGGSTPQWVKEEIDLSPYAGQRIMLRFEVVNDEAVNLEGFAVDDIAIPELGFYDDAEQEQGWDAKGFVRTDNSLPQSFIVQVIEQGKEARVRRMELGPDQKGELRISGFGKDVERAVLLVSGATPVTTEKASFHVSVKVNGSGG
ncbi:MAG: immune inhibitor A [Chloroflexi bacterium]|nr:immune inhibitor A [Chloroflexota bacterium]